MAATRPHRGPLAAVLFENIIDGLGPARPSIRSRLFPIRTGLTDSARDSAPGPAPGPDPGAIGV